MNASAFLRALACGTTLTLVAIDAVAKPAPLDATPLATPEPAPEPADAAGEPEPSASEPAAEPTPTPEPGTAPAPDATPEPATGSIRLEVTPPEPPPPAPPEPAPPYDGPPVLLGARKAKLGGYGALGVAYSHMLHRDGVVTDLEGALLIDHRLTLGLAGYIFSRTPRGPASDDGTPRHFGAGYGGFLARYAVYTSFPVYVSFGVLVGGGVVVLGESIGDHDRDRSYRDDYDSANDEHEGFAMFQPDLSLHVNLTRWLRVSATGGYRAATSVRRFGYGSGAVSGPVVGANVAMGWF